MSHEVCLTGMDHPRDHHTTTNYIQKMLSCYSGYCNQDLEPWTSSVMVYWSKYDGADIDMVSHHFMIILWSMDNIGQGWVTLQTTRWPHTTLWIYSDVTLDVWTKSFLNHGPHQWCSSPRMMTQVWVCFLVIPWVWYESLTISGREESYLWP